MGLAHEAVKVVGSALHNVHAGSEKLASHKLAGPMAPSLVVTSTAFTAGTPLPISATLDGLGAPPPICWDNVPPSAKSLVLLCEDPDAPLLEPFVHWIVYDMPAVVRSVDAESVHMMKQGKNSKLDAGFTGAAPPPGHGVHHYHFQVFALDVVTESAPYVGRGALFDLMRDHVVAWGEIVGTYERT